MDWIFVGLLAFLAIALFMGGRDIAGWYFKINERIKLQEQNNDLLRQLIRKIDEKNKSNNQLSK